MDKLDKKNKMAAVKKPANDGQAEVRIEQRLADTKKMLKHCENVFIGPGRKIFHEPYVLDLMESDDEIDSKLGYELFSLFEKCKDEGRKKKEFVKFEFALALKVRVLERMATIMVERKASVVRRKTIVERRKTMVASKLPKSVTMLPKN